MKSFFRYHFIPKGQIRSLTPVYESTVSKKTQQEFTSSYVPFRQYFELFPVFLERFIFRHPKHFVLEMGYCAHSDLLELTCLSHAGIYKKIIAPQNIIPATFADYVNTSKFNLFEHTKRVDYNMIYFNKVQTEFYLFDREGQWHEVEQLSLDRLFDEKEYLNEPFI